jgi:preprotein translocase subunit SecD
MRLERRAALIALMGAACASYAGATWAAAPRTPRFAIRLVDETVDGAARTGGPPGSDRFPLKVFGIGGPGARWLKREGGVEGELAEVHVANVPGGGLSRDFSYVVQFTLTDKGRADFARLTRENIGKGMAIVLNGEIIMYWRDDAEFTDGKAQLAGAFTEAEARDLAAAMMATIQAKAN